MLEILIIYSACSKLSGFAKERGGKATGYCWAFVGIYILALIAGGSLGATLQIMPVLGAYMVAIPAAIATYFAFKSQICKVPRGHVPPNPDDIYRPPGQ